MPTEDGKAAAAAAKAAQKAAAKLAADQAAAMAAQAASDDAKMAKMATKTFKFAGREFFGKMDKKFANSATIVVMGDRKTQGEAFNFAIQTVAISKKYVATQTKVIQENGSLTEDDKKVKISNIGLGVSNARAKFAIGFLAKKDDVSNKSAAEMLEEIIGSDNE